MPQRQYLVEAERAFKSDPSHGLVLQAQLVLGCADEGKLERHGPAPLAPNCRLNAAHLLLTTRTPPCFAGLPPGPEDVGLLDALELLLQSLKLPLRDEGERCVRARAARRAAVAGVVAGCLAWSRCQDSGSWRVYAS